MCQNNLEIKFCTCAKMVKENMNEYYWVLNRFIGTKENNRRGKIAIPLNDLGNGITTDNIIEFLNKNNCFDFEYLPQDLDTLVISIFKENNHRNYFSLIFKNNSWIKGNNPAFRSIKKPIAEGKVEVKNC